MRNPRGKTRLLPGIAAVCCIGALPGDSTLGQERYDPIDTKLAHEYHQNAQAMCEADGGKLWGVNLHGPMLFVDPQSRAVVANQADQAGLLQEHDGVFVGQFPKDRIIANTATPWAGVNWAMILWPLPEDRRTRDRLMTHELWHRVQHGLLAPGKEDGTSPGSESANSHLDTRDGRVFLQLEWRALEAALLAQGSDRRSAIEDALVFRAHRRLLFPSAAAEERALQLNEGLAEYTGIRLSTASSRDAITEAVAGLRRGPERETFVRSFAYASGPAYGLLLDDALPHWRRGLTTTTDLSDLLQAGFSIDLPTAVKEEAERRAERYEGSSLMVAESKREAARQQRAADNQRRFVEGPVLVIRLTSPNVQFNPGNLQPLGDLGTVYPTMTLADVWGTLNVTNGALLNSTWSEVRVVAPKHPTEHVIEGDGWTLKLNKGWTLRPLKRPADFTVAREQGD